MNCNEMDRWLDEGQPEHVASEATAHARSCPRCTAALRAAGEVESLLEADVPAAPAGFTDRVMARVKAVEPAVAPIPAPLPYSFPWWVRAAAEPATALSTVLAGLVVWQANTLTSIASSLSERWARGLSVLDASSSLGATLGHPEVMLGVTFAMLPAAVWVAWVLYGWSERRVLHSMRRPSDGPRRWPTARTTPAGRPPTTG